MWHSAKQLITRLGVGARPKRGRRVIGGQPRPLNQSSRRRLGPGRRRCALEAVEERLLLTFHLWKIDEVFSSADGKAQAIELSDPANGENHLAGHFISSNGNKFNFPADLPTDATANHHLLIGTASYAALPGAVQPDYVIPDNFFNPAGDSFDYADVDAFSFTAGQVPTDGTNALARDVNSGALSTGKNSETNLAGQTGSVTVGATQTNHAPTIDAIADPAPILPNAGEQTVNLTGITAGAGETQNITVTATSDNTALIPNPTVTYSSPSATGTLRYTPLAGAQGTATITVTVKDDGGTAGGGTDTTTRTFTVRVAPPNHAPTLDAIADPAAIREGTTQPTTVPLTGITAGAGETQRLTVSATSDNPALVPNPTVNYASPGATGTLSFVPAPGSFGTATITVQVKDDGGTAGGGVDTVTRSFHVTVTAVNQPPTIDPIADPPPILPGSGQQVISLTGISAGSHESQTISITASSSNPSLIANPQVAYTSPNATGTLTYTPVAGAKGAATITVTLKDDGGTADGGSDTTVKTFVVTVGLTPPQAFVQHLFADVLGRQPDGGELATFASQVTDPASRATVARALLSSPEHESEVIQSVYQALLGRAAESAGVAYWQQQMAGGTDETALIASVAGSDEFFNHVGGSNESFVGGLYQALLGRAGEQQGTAFWLQMAGSETRSAIAQGFVGSAEFRGLLVDDPAERFTALQGWFQNYFHRNADDAGRAFFADELAGHTSANDAQIQMIASDEYFAQNG
jgi:hypothetical protein